MRRAALVGALALFSAVTVCPVAGAAPLRHDGAYVVGGDGSSSFFSEPGLVAVRDIGGAVTGGISVTFRGDPRAGCTLIGVCGYSGVATLDLSGTPSDLSLLTERSGQRRRTVAMLNLETEFQNEQLRVVTNRTSPGAPGATCIDATPLSAASGTVLAITGGHVGVSLLDGAGGLFASRCAGPRDADLRAALPTVNVPLGRLARGEQRINLSGTRSFSGGGFSGTVRSTVVLHLGRASSAQSAPTEPPGKDAKLLRRVEVPVRLVTGTGSLTARIAGDPAGGCALLDSCNATGAIAIAPRPSVISDRFEAYGRATRPLRDFLTALDMARGGHTAGIQTFGALFVNGGTETELLAQNGLCHEQVPFPGGVLFFSGRRVQLLSEAAGSSTQNVFHCPAPQVGVAALAKGNLASGQLAAHRTSFTLRPTLSGSDDGWTFRGGGSVTFTIVRGHPTVHVLRESSGY